MRRPPEDKRLQAMLEVWAGRRTAKDAAASLGISRKSFYQWEARALEGMRASLQRGRPGRPSRRADPRQTQLETENRQLREDLLILQQRDRIRGLLAESMTRAQKKSGGHDRG